MSCRVPVEELPEFDTHVGHQTRDVGGADSGSGKFGDHGVLQTHDEAKQHLGCRHEQPFVLSEIAAEQTEADEAAIKDSPCFGLSRSMGDRIRTR